MSRIAVTDSRDRDNILAFVMGSGRTYDPDSRGLMWELAPAQPERRKFVTRHAIIARGENAEDQYFRLHPVYWRANMDVPLTRTDEGCEPEWCNLWVDLDHTTLEEFEDLLRRWKLPYPSLIWETGSDKRGGLWALWKLTGKLSAEWVGLTNRMLAVVLGGDSAVANPSTLARMPYVFHHRTGVQGLVIHFDRERHSFKEFEKPLERAYLEAVEETERRFASFDKKPTAVASDYSEVEAECDLALLTDEHVAYIKEWDASGRNGDRSRVEQSIFYRLVSLGYSDAEIAYLAHRKFGLLKVGEEIAHNRHGQVMHRIAEARSFFEEHGGQKRNWNPDTLRADRHRREFLSLFTEARQSTNDLIRAGMQATGLKARQCFNLRLKALRKHYITLDNRITQYGEEALKRTTPLFDYEDLPPLGESILPPETETEEWDTFCFLIAEAEGRFSKTPTYLSDCSTPSLTVSSFMQSSRAPP